MEDPESETLIALITDPDAPTALTLGFGGNSDARVADLVRFVQGRLEDQTPAAIEAALDRVILSHGGKRARAIDLDQMLASLWLRLRRRPYETGPEVYEIPKELFAQAGIEQHKIQLPPERPPPRNEPLRHRLARLAEAAMTQHRWGPAIGYLTIVWLCLAAFPRLLYWLRWPTRLGPRGLLAYVAFKTALRFARRAGLRWANRITEQQQAASRPSASCSATSAGRANRLAPPPGS